MRLPSISALGPLLLPLVPLRAPSPIQCEPLTAQTADKGHTFVLHGDVLALSSDAVLVPTRNLNNTNWFPDGPPPGAKQSPREIFTPSRRVVRVEHHQRYEGRPEPVSSGLI